MDEENQQPCAVCFELLHTQIRATLPCAHTFCLKCVVRLSYPQSCPLCRRDIQHLMPTHRAQSTPPPHVSFTLRMRHDDGDDDNNDDDALAERVRVALLLRDALLQGAAPRNRRPIA